MEISSIQSSLSLLFKNSSENTKNTKATGFSLDNTDATRPTFQVERDSGIVPDFAAITPSDLRVYARSNFDQGVIDQDTFAAISEPLPTHAIDTMGNLIDLSDVTDGTEFNFQDYYRTQLALAQSIGDADQARTMESVVSFLEAQ